MNFHPGIQPPRRCKRGNFTATQKPSFSAFRAGTRIARKLLIKQYPSDYIPLRYIPLERHLNKLSDGKFLLIFIGACCLYAPLKIQDTENWVSDNGYFVVVIVFIMNIT